MNGGCGYRQRMSSRAWAVRKPDEVAKVVGKNLGDMERAYIRQRGRDILEVMGGKAKAALPYLDKLIAREDRALEQAGKNGMLDKWDKWDLENLKKTRNLKKPGCRQVVNRKW